MIEYVDDEQVKASKNVGHHGCPTTKVLKLHWPKCPKRVPKKKFGPENKSLKTSYLEFTY